MDYGKALRWIGEIAHKARWTTAYINSLPNSSFAVIEKGYDPNKAGMSDKRARHLPFKDTDGNIDLPHLRNALARVNQIQSVLGTESAEDLRKRALAKLTAAAKEKLPESGTAQEAKS